MNGLNEIHKPDQDPAGGVDESVTCSLIHVLLPNPSRLVHALRSIMEILYARRQITSAIRRLEHPDAQVQERARQQLRDARREIAWPILARVAFRQRSRIAILAANLLYEMGDAEGLYALLSQFADRFMVISFSSELRTSLRNIGVEQIVTALDMSLTRIETRLSATPHTDDWALSLAVYCFNALKALNGQIPYPLWRRATTLSLPGFEDLRTCRTVVPLQSESPLDDWRVGSTLVAVRRSAIDALLDLDRPHAFELMRDALAHPDMQVQLTAIYGLRRLRDSRAYVLLQPLAADRRHPLSKDARRAIEAFGTRQPDALTLVRGSAAAGAAPTELLRPAVDTDEVEPAVLLRPNEQG